MAVIAVAVSYSTYCNNFIEVRAGVCKTLQRPRVSEDDSRHSDCYIKRGRDCDNDWKHT